VSRRLLFGLILCIILHFAASFHGHGRSLPFQLKYSVYEDEIANKAFQIIKSLILTASDIICEESDISDTAYFSRKMILNV